MVRREMCKWLDERALGIEAEMILAEMRAVASRRFRCLLSSATEWRWVLSQNHCSGKPDGAAARDGMTCAIVGANNYSPLRNGRNSTATAPERPN